MQSKNIGCGGDTDRKKGYRRENKLVKVLLSSLCVLVTMSFLLLPHLIFAEEIFDLGEVVVTATRIPQILKDIPASVTVITEKQIQSSHAQNVAEVLKEVAGIQIQDYGLNSLKSISIRGSSAAQVLILVDGRVVNAPSLGSADLSAFSLVNVQQIEIVRGSFSALYGSAALGGVVNIITKRPPEKATTNAGFSGGSFGTSTFNVLHGGGTNSLHYLVTAEKGSSTGDRENSASDFFNLSAKITVSSFVASVGYARSEKGAPGSLDWPNPNATQNDTRGWVDLTCDWQSGKSAFSLKSFFNQDETIYENPDWFLKDTTNNGRCGASFQHAMPWGPWSHFIWGIDWKQDYVDIRAIDGSSRIGGERSLISTAVYAEEELQPSSEVILTLGARYDNHSAHGDQVSPRLGALYHLGAFTTLRSSWGTAFRAPTVNDLYWYEDWGGGMGLFGNPDLSPEKSSEFELGIERVFTSSVLGRVTYFSANIDNLIGWVEVFPWRWEVQNVDKASISGVEGEIKLRAGEKMSLFFTYTYLDAKDRGEFKENVLPYRAQNTLSLGLDYKVQEKLQFRLEGQVIGERYTNRENTNTLPSYTVVGAQLIFHPSKRTEMFVKVDNLLNEKYENIKGYPMPGTTVKGGMQLTL